MGGEGKFDIKVNIGATVAILAAALAAGFAAGDLKCVAASFAAATVFTVMSIVGLLPVIGPILYHTWSGSVMDWYLSMCPWNPVVELARWLGLALATVFTILVILVPAAKMLKLE